MKYLFACVCSSLIGAMIAIWSTDGRSSNPAEAQDSVRDRGGPAFPDTSKSRGGTSKAGTPRAAAAPRLPGPLGPEELTPEEQVNVAVYENVNRSVAHITTKGASREGFFLMEVPTEGTGSGSVIDKAGHILTNYHVVEGARQVAVTLFDGKSYDAKFLGADQINDVAIIKIDAPSDVLYPVAFGDSHKLKVGMRVFAIGNPFGLERTLTTGIISSLNRSLQVHESRTIKQIIQIDAAINPGSSGGPLLDSHSHLIGMNTAIASKTGQSAGVGFAIPISLIARIVPQLIERGRVVRPEIGIAKVYETELGLLVYKLIPGGPAERAGMRGPAAVTRRKGPFVIEQIDRSAADLITAVDDQKVTNSDDFLAYIESKEPGQTVTVTVVRQGRELRLPVQLGGGDEGTPASRNR